jgi:hypothetical protein
MKRKGHRKELPVTRGYSRRRTLPVGKFARLWARRVAARFRAVEIRGRSLMKIICTLGLLSSVTLAASTVVSTIASADSLIEQVVDTRLVLAFRVDPAELKKVIPDHGRSLAQPLGA